MSPQGDARVPNVPLTPARIPCQTENRVRCSAIHPTQRQRPSETRNRVFQTAFPFPPTPFVL
ncbi:hypothetical protein [Kingella potus]|uniref:hypothetical protein n=1 Tax=Kingella potus TaxID=265175 RepID=UPI000E1B7B23|nr:hypothetical protein [Kingella potus]UOP01461.1 hypothetical protein LVJ84_04475 [Kingella potus]